MPTGIKLHCGGSASTLDDLRFIKLPEETRTYKPVSHYDLAMNISKTAEDLLAWDMDHVLSEFALASNGQRMFAKLTYRDPDNDEMGLSIAFRNSYDKSIRVGIAVGASVFICDNLCLAGEVTIFRKHTKNVLEDMNRDILDAIHRGRTKFDQIVDDAQELRAMALNDDESYKLIGLLYGRKVLSKVSQIPVASKQWEGGNNKWDLYNACTEALKSTSPNKIMECHINLHSILMGA